MLLNGQYTQPFQYRLYNVGNSYSFTNSGSLGFQDWS